MSALTRRTVLGVAAVAPFAAPLGKAAPAAGAMSPRFAAMAREIERLMGEAARLRQETENPVESDHAIGLLYGRRFEIEEAIGRTPPLSFGDVILKLRIIADLDGAEIGMCGYEEVSLRGCLAFLEGVGGTN